MVNPKAIYSITPTTKEVALAKAQAIKQIPVDRWDTEQLFRNRFSKMEEEGKIKKIELEEQPESSDEELDF
jgi:hypothetical protein